MSRKKISPQKKITYYKLNALSNEADDENLVSDNEFEVEGELEDHIIISVSPNMSHRSVDELLKKLSEVVSRPVIVITHNIQFLKATKLSQKEATAIAKREGHHDDETNTNTNADIDIMGREPVKVYSDRN
jgi:hypothetical protein